MDEGWVAAVVGAIGGWLVGLFNGWLRWRSDRGQQQVARDSAAFEGYDELVHNLRDELDRYRDEVAQLRTDHTECREQLVTQGAALERVEAELATVRDDHAQLREDHKILLATVVTQIQAEVDRDEP